MTPWAQDAQSDQGQTGGPCIRSCHGVQTDSVTGAACRLITVPRDTQETGPLGPGQRGSLTRMKAVVMRMPRGEAPELVARETRLRCQSLHGGKDRNPAQIPSEANFRNRPKHFASPRRDGWFPAPFPPPFSPLATLSRRKSRFENPQYLRASLRKAPDCRNEPKAESRLSRLDILQSS
jgi:hypothetical protein